MYINSKREKGIVLIVATFFLLFLLGVVIKKEEKDAFIRTEAIGKFCQGEKVGIYKSGLDTSEQSSEILIGWWEDNENEKKYFFLPSGSWKQKFVWMIPDSMSVSIENEEIYTGDEFDLSQGEYEVVIEKDDVKNVCVLEVLESSKIASLFMKLEENGLEYIHREKGNSAAGNYLVLDAQGRVENLGKIEAIRGRGNVSWVDSDKKSYQITLQEKKSLLGMPAEKKWVLIPNAFDDTLIRNKVCNDLAHGLGLEHTTKCGYIDLYIDGEYRGNYLLSEKVEIDNNRIAINNLEKENEILNKDIELAQNIKKVNDNGVVIKGSILENEPEDITGGYLLELESPKRFENEKNGFITSRGQCVIVQSPEYASEKQLSYIAERYQCFENAIYSEDGHCPFDGKGFTEYIDIESFAKKYLLEELSKNHDAHITSQFFYKPEDKISDKIFAGPAWDYDKALGINAQNYVGLDLKIPEGIHVGVQKRDYDVWYGLYCQEEFMDVVYQIFKSELEWIVKKEVNYAIPDLVFEIEDSVKMNHIRWNVYGNLTMEEKIGRYRKEVFEIQDFLVNRMEFLEDEWNL